MWLNCIYTHFFICCCHSITTIIQILSLVGFFLFLHFPLFNKTHYLLVWTSCNSRFSQINPYKSKFTSLNWGASAWLSIFTGSGRFIIPEREISPKWGGVFEYLAEKKDTLASLSCFGGNKRRGSWLKSQVLKSWNSKFVTESEEGESRSWQANVM